MPVPVPKSESPAPRRLLRDVVFDKMLAAIADGTLELGERLNDDELVRWLGVSRTPVREAIAKLADFGLVDIEANRYTRIISPSLEDFADTTATAFDVWAVVTRRGIPLLSAAEANEVTSLISTVKRSSSGEIRTDAIANFGTAMKIIAAASSSPSVLRLLETVSDRATLLIGLATRQVSFGVAPALLQGLSDAVAARDGKAAAEVLLSTHDTVGDYVAAVGAAGVFPEKRAL
ncbi:GntR family transcriptional regulator [Frondihabitans australicus]|uniref:DNA-binding GntR family transcriptional regulator n=1 Tax=Frondihabitans australicus TaxID=386892 RepID=A0A495IKQ1_9MICO|nr:GntR family transcriptional regulator [Frondihabitans australicus]RKR75726.1 DNA-binding GntR family transcriptional regulator [Frondihabitans australicus]